MPKSQVSRDALLRAAFAVSQDAFVLLEAIRDASHAVVDFRVMDLNDAGAAVYGTAPPDRLIGRRLLELRPAAAEDGSLERYVAAVQSGEPERDELRLELPGMPVRWLWRQAMPSGDGLVVTVHDITGRKAAEEAVRESEERFANAFRFAAHGMALLNADGRWQRVNHALCDMVGYSEDELLQVSFADITHPDDLEADLAQVRRLDAGEIESYEIEKRYLHRAGHVVWVLLAGSAVRGPDGRPVSYIAHIQDVTVRKAMERELRERTERMRAMLVVQQEIGAAGLDIVEVIQRGVDAMRPLTGADTLSVALPRGDELIYDAVSGTAAASRGVRLRIDRSLSGLAFTTRQTLRSDDTDADPRVDHESARRADARSLVAVPLLANGRVVGVLNALSHRPRAFSEDQVGVLHLLGGMLAATVARSQAFAAEQAVVAERTAALEALQRTEADLRHQAEELARSNAELEQFAYVASHDLQEPLRAVAGFTQLLERRYGPQLDDRARQYIGFAVEGAERMQRLIRDLLAYSRVTTHGEAPRPVSADESLAGALRALAVAIEESAAVVTHDPLPVVLGDASQLTRVFQNLVGNAVKFRRADVPPAVHVSAARRGDAWRFAIRDNGIGIAPEYFERIFTIFQRLHGRDRYPGSGIGLSISRRIVERHGGRLWLESVPGAGTTFYFTLPAADERSPGESTPRPTESQ